MTTQAHGAEKPMSGWRRFWANLNAFAEAMDMSESEFLHRRLASLEVEVAALKHKQAGK
ncbi:MAG: hypothetical protein KJ872_12200 [Alphaproteobacteria bacterium]|nr:hypothetical protein [Alphaproteobacteria bacterium]